MENLGGKIETGYLCFGDYDVVVITEFPKNTDAAAFAMVCSAGGAVKGFKTTPLLTAKEGVEAMQSSSRSGYEPPG